MAHLEWKSVIVDSAILHAPYNFLLEELVTAVRRLETCTALPLPNLLKVGLTL